MKKALIILITVFLFGCPSKGDRNPLGPSPMPVETKGGPKFDEAGTEIKIIIEPIPPDPSNFTAPSFVGCYYLFYEHEWVQFHDNPDWRTGDKRKGWGEPDARYCMMPIYPDPSTLSSDSCIPPKEIILDFGKPKYELQYPRCDQSIDVGYYPRK